MYKCTNCSQSLPSIRFDEHICDFSDPKTIVYDDEKMSILWENSALRQIYAENNAEIEDILKSYEAKEEKKPQVKKTVSLGNHKCVICSRVYVHASGLLRHIEAQHNKNILSTNKTARRSNPKDKLTPDVVKCLVCGQIFNSTAACFAHLKSIHTKYSFDESEISLKVGDSLLFAKLKLDQGFQCEFCEIMFASTSDLFDHTMEHETNKGFECNSCHFTSRNLTLISNHRSSKCPDNTNENQKINNFKWRFACSDCGEAFETLTSLYDHRYVCYEN